MYLNQAYSVLYQNASQAKAVFFVTENGLRTIVFLHKFYLMLGN